MKFLLKFLSAEKRAMILLGQEIVSCLDTKAEREAALAFGIEMLKDGKVTVPEWSQFGSKLGILRGRTKKQ